MSEIISNKQKVKKHSEGKNSQKSFLTKKKKIKNRFKEKKSEIISKNKSQKLFQPKK